MPEESPLDRLRRSLGGPQTSLEGALEAMGKEREEQILERIRDYADLVVLIASKLQEFIGHYVSDSFPDSENAARELDRLESVADDYKQEIGDRLSTGGVFAMGRGDLARLVTAMDVIANYSVGAADRMAMRRVARPPKFDAMMREIAAVDLEAVQTLRDAIVAMQTDLRTAIEIAGRVDKIESRVDDLYAAMYALLFDFDTDYKTFIQLRSILERLESVADAAAESAELVRHIALEYLE
jgi:predicted phosphate transport protein (TIGR00153 family)